MSSVDPLNANWSCYLPQYMGQANKCNQCIKSCFTATLLTLTARQLREKALPDVFRPESSVMLSGQKVSEAGKGGYGAVFAKSRAAGFAIAE